ncbi:hypothetical protein QYQ99_27245 [Comamonas testosteroni]|uniref:hypothetical protein n=1 Tax=Comamonas testosteroni TaxID=285 RepID=UPI00265DF6DE|nr:hypothetical protein [Comamonas testosteroni]WKL15961.1 hypothetical protein QYQ99_27245 [Comamonas testosteroni]
MTPTEIAIAAINPTGFLVQKLAERIWTEDSPEKKVHDLSIEKLAEEARRQEIAMEMEAARAKVAQELAIARRIELAEEVEIEEFYDVSGEGAAGLKADTVAKTIAVGLSGSGKRVTKRIYKFRGFGALQEASVETDPQ